MPPPSPRLVEKLRPDASPRAHAVRQLAWREGRPEDKPRLTNFCCARTQKHGKRTIFPFPWEKPVQSAVRRVKPTCDARSAILLGEDPETSAIFGLVSVQKLPDAANAYLIEMIAVDTRAKGQHVGDQAMIEALQWIENHADAAGLTSVVVIADCHPRNKRARALLRRSSFTSIGGDRNREEWFYNLSLSP